MGSVNLNLTCFFYCNFSPPPCVLVFGGGGPAAKGMGWGAGGGGGLRGSRGSTPCAHLCDNVK